MFLATGLSVIHSLSHIYMDNAVCWHHWQSGVCIFAIRVFFCQVSDMFRQLAKNVLGHVNCPAVWRHGTSFSASVGAVTACSNVLRRKSTRRGTRVKKKEGSCGVNAEQLKGRGARPRVHSREHCVWQHDTAAQTAEMSRALLSNETASSALRNKHDTSLRYAGF